ncbi:MAG: DUF1549 domain-containing protein [Planctomycetes bacterium]|nr:DUF1549 domain-containing protein [Planctomycetota bacterium]
MSHRSEQMRFGTRPTSARGFGSPPCRSPCRSPGTAALRVALRAVLRVAIRLAMLLVAGTLPAGTGSAAEPERLQFARDLLPLLSNHCFPCHGPDEKERQAGLRLDQRRSATARLDSGKQAIVPGKPELSELVHRIDAGADDDQLMPPASMLKPLSVAQRKLLVRWIAEGAEYETHWAFQTPRAPPIPPLASPRLRSPIDAFVLDRLQREGIEPAAEARSETLLRRIGLDLNGIPPTPDDQDRYRMASRGEESPDAYEREVDRLLASPRFGERTAMVWLDAARYADTNGYNNDEDRVMWRWRDWVIEALNRDQPYDQFVVEQLAGDLLPQATLDQRIATGFNRNHVLTTEGGIIDEEYRVEYVADRLHTTASVLMGLSMQCARCHDHKFDPISQREYYQLFSFFNQSPDKVLGYNKGAPATPYLPAPTRLQQEQLDRNTQRESAIRERIAARIASAEAEADAAAWERELNDQDRAQLAAPAGLELRLTLDDTDGDSRINAVTTKPEARVEGPARSVPGKLGQAFETDGKAYLSLESAGEFERDQPVSFGAWIRSTTDGATTVLSRMHDSAAYRGYDLNIEAGRVAVHLIHHWPDNGLKVLSEPAVKKGQWHHLFVTYDGSSRAAGVRVFVDGSPRKLEIANDSLGESIRTDRPFHVGRRGEGNGFSGAIDDVRWYRAALTPEQIGRLAKGEPVDELAAILAQAPADRTAEQRKSLLRYYLERFDKPTLALNTELAACLEERKALDSLIPTSLVMQDLPERRVTHLLLRGQYDQPGPVVEPGVPDALSAWRGEFPGNRLGLAQWLIDPNHPLTSRVAVNRWWGMFWPAGLVETAEDFGLQGAFPTHLELLDWLATTYQRPSSPAKSGEPTPRGLGWRTKSLVRMLVLSSVYRQSSDAGQAQREVDPQNRLLGRGARMRLPAELLRDQALSASGLLVERQGGPSVLPYQPTGLWEDVSVERRVKYTPDPGAGLYRRSLYTFWKRTCPPPGMTTFDAPDREFCVVRRARTNTPLQALVLMNDVTYVEAARLVAQRVLLEAPADWDGQLEYATQLTLHRLPQAEERSIIGTFYQQALDRFRQDPEAASQLLSIGAAPSPTGPLAGARNQPELAAWTAVGNLLLNLDEALTRE